MSTDVIISEVPARSYTVPAALTSSLGERATLDLVYDTMNSRDESARLWAEKIINSIERDRSRQEEAVLASINYSPDKYLYWGLAAAGDEDMLHTIARIEHADTNIVNAEILSKNQSWRPISRDIIANSNNYGVAMNASLIAFTASAFAEGCAGVILAYGDPLCFLSKEPITSLPILASVDAPGSGRIYAIVDATDTTAVMNVILIKPGPEVYRRDGGSWVLDNATLDSLLSVNPPPLVELTGDTAKNVLDQVDGNQANQLAPDSSGEATEGDMLEANPVEIDPKKAIDSSDSKSSSKQAIPSAKPSATPSKDTYANNQNKSQLKDGSTSRTASLLARYDEIEAMTASIRRLSPKVSADLRIEETKASLLFEASRYRRDLEDRERILSKLMLPALTADATSMHDVTPNQQKATHLRKYWVRGAGAVKIRWGAPGDFTRCVGQLQKYLGERAKGYCAKRHREVTNMWPGDKRNTGPNKGRVAKNKLNTD